MTGIEKITDRILADANAKAKNITESAEREVSEIKARYSAEADRIAREINDGTERTCTEIIGRAKAQAAVTRRDAVLSAQASIIDEAFDRALGEILSFPKEKYGTMLAIMLSKLLRECLEAQKKAGADKTELIEVILNARDRDAHKDTLLEELRRLVVGRITVRDLERVKISKEIADIKGGVILKCGPLEYNLSLELLFRELRPDAEPAVYSALFGLRD